MRLIDAEPIEQALFKLADKSLAKNPYENARICAFRRAFELILGAPTIAPPPNGPLTLEQLREMDGELVWVESCRNAKSGKYVILDGYDQSLYCLRVIGGGLLDCAVMGKAWLAYRRKPEEG